MPPHRRVEINVGLKCNNRCVFCMSGMLRDIKQPWASAESVKKELDYFFRKGCRELGFLGGEPTVYPHLIECIRHAKRLGYRRIAICTNGTRLSDPQFCRRLALAGLNRVAISFHSHKEEIEDRLATRVPGNFNKKVAGLNHVVALVREGLMESVSLNPVLNRKNYKDMGGYIAYFMRLGITDIRFNYIWPQGDVIKDTTWIPTYREAMPEIVRIMLLNEKRFKIRLSFGAIPLCALRFGGVSRRLSEHLASKYLDESAFDAPTEVGHLGHGTAGAADRFVWQERKRNELKTMGPDCKACRYRERCEGVWKSYADLYGLDELMPTPMEERASGGSPSQARAVRPEDSVISKQEETGEGVEHVLRTSFACNQRCLFCYADLSGRRVTLAEIEKSLEEIRRHPPEKTWVTISGGEPTGNSRLCDIIKLAHEKGFHDIVLQTNAVHLSQRALVDRLVEEGVTIFFISFHSFRPEIYDVLTGSRGQYPRALKGIGNLLSHPQANAKFGVIFNIVINRLNFADLSAHMDFLHGISRDRGGSVRVFFSLMNDMGHQRAPSLAVDLREIAPSLNDALRRCRSLGIGVEKFVGTCSLPLCLAEDPAPYVSDFRVSQANVGVYLDEFNGRRLPERAKHAVCMRCRYNHQCLGVPMKYARLYGVEALRPIQSGCS